MREKDAMRGDNHPSGLDSDTGSNKRCKTTPYVNRWVWTRSRRDRGRLRSIGHVFLGITLTLALGIVPFSTAHAVSAPTTKPMTELNPVLAGACGIPVILVLDESGSIDITLGAESAVRNAASSFVNALADTGSELAIVEYGSRAKKVFDYTQVTSGASGTAGTMFDPYIFATATSGDVYEAPSQLGSTTNWDDALDKVEALNNDSGVAPLVVFITDGDPTSHILDYMGESGEVGFFNATQSLWRAMEEANAVKTQGSKILVVGVGGGLSDPASQQRLQDISGPNVAPPATVDIETNDVLLVTDFSDLEAEMRQIAFQLCAPAVSFTKKVGGTATAGWDFVASVSVPSGSFEWKAPLPAPSPITNPNTGTTDALGTVTFQWEPALAVDSTLVFNEVLQAGYEFDGASCTRKTLTTTGITESTFDPGNVVSSQTMTVGPNDIVTCEVNNRSMPIRSLRLAKTANPTTYSAVGAVINYSFAVTNNGNVSLAGPVSVADDKATDESCPAVSTVGNGNGSLDPGESIACTASYTITQTDLNNGSVTNTATANADGVTSGPAQATVTAVQNPVLNIDKVLTDNADEDGSGAVTLNDTLTYQITATNDGNITLNNVVVSDDLTGQSTSCPTLVPGGTCVLTVMYVVTQADVNAAQIVNTGTADSDETPPVSDTETTPVVPNSLPAPPPNCDGDDGPKSPLDDTTNLSDAEKAAYALYESVILMTKAKIHATSCDSTAGSYPISIFTNGGLVGDPGEDNTVTVDSPDGSYSLDADPQPEIPLRGQFIGIRQIGSGVFDGHSVSGLSGSGIYNQAKNMLIFNGNTSVVGSNGRPDLYSGTLIKDFCRGSSNSTDPEFFLIYDYGLEALSKLGYPTDKYWQRSKSRRYDGASGRTVFVQDRLVGATACRIVIDTEGVNSEDVFWQDGTLTVTTDRPGVPVPNLSF